MKGVWKQRPSNYMDRLVAKMQRDLEKMKRDPFFNGKLKNEQRRTTEPVKTPLPR